MIIRTFKLYAFDNDVLEDVARDYGFSKSELLRVGLRIVAFLGVLASGDGTLRHMFRKFVGKYGNTRPELLDQDELLRSLHELLTKLLEKSS